VQNATTLNRGSLDRIMLVRERPAPSVSVPVANVRPVPRAGAATPAMVNTADSTLSPLGRPPTSPERAAANRQGCLVIAAVIGVFVAIWILYSIGSFLPPPVPITLLILGSVGCVLLRKRISWNSLTWLAPAALALVFLLVFSISAASERRKKENDALYASRQAQLAQQKVDTQRAAAWNSHLRRVAWNQAHPKEVAAAKARLQAQSEAKRLAAEVWAKQHPPVQSERERIEAIPFDTRLAAAKKEFDERAGDAGLFASGTILSSDVRNSKLVLMIDQAAWDQSSSAVRDAINSTAESLWQTSCSNHYACDAEDIYSKSGSNTLDYLFTSYFDSR
jgi:hypothetical protein